MEDPFESIRQMAMDALDQIMPPDQAATVRELIEAHNRIADRGGPGAAGDEMFSPEGTRLAMDGIIHTAISNAQSLGLEGREIMRFVALVSLLVGVEVQKERQRQLDAITAQGGRS